MSENAAIVQVDGVSKSYDATTKALDTVSFQLGAGFHALLGSNGAGKSTLFQLLTGLFMPDQGNIHIHGHNIRRKLTQVLASMGVVFQQPALDLDLSVEANLAFYARLHGLSKPDIQIRSQIELEALGIIDVAKRRCRTLSGGNRRKVELVRALLTQPALLLMDEPTVGLDPASRDSLLHYVLSLCEKRGLCVLWATHLIDEAEAADQVLVLNKGKLLAQDTPAALCEQTGQARLLDAFFQLSGETPTPLETAQAI